MVDEPTAGTATPPESAQTGAAAPEGSPPGPTAEPPDTSGQEAITPDAGGEEGADAGEGDDKGAAAPAWASVTDPEALFEHEAVKPLHEQRVQQARDEALDTVLQLGDEHRQYVERQEQSLRSAVGRLQSLDNAIADLAEQGHIDQAALRRVLGEHNIVAQLQQIDQQQKAIGKERETWGGVLGWKGAVSTLLKEAGADEAVVERMVRRTERAFRVASDDPKALYGDLTKAITQAATKPLRDEITELKAKVTRLEAEGRNANRQNGAPPAGPTGGAGGAKPYSQMTADERAKLTPEQRDRMAAGSLR